MEDHAVYVLLTRTHTTFSRFIHLMTHDPYTHAAIGVDGEDGLFYGFGRKYPNLPFPGAFRAECPWKFRHDAPVRIYRIDVSEDCYQMISQVLRKMYREKDIYSYNLLGVVLCRFNLHLPVVRQHHFFCSQFVAWLLEGSGAVKLPVSSDLFRPSYFCDLPCAKLVYEGGPVHTHKPSSIFGSSGTRVAM